MARVTTKRPSPKPAVLSDREYRALAQFRGGLRRFLHFSEEAAREAGTTPAQHQLLLAVRGFAGPGTPVVGDLAEALQLRHHSAVELVDRAERAGLVVRTPDPDDLRRQHVALTAAGRRLLEQLSVVHRDELRRFRTQMVDLLAALD
jgi:DNA-binding MarR family transcriptional regulator